MFQRYWRRTTSLCSSLKGSHGQLLRLSLMPPTKRLSVNHHHLSGKSLSVGVSLGSAPKLQFPSLPQQWKDRYVPGQMYRYQDSLPKLPVPSLQQTLEKYVACVEPLLSEKELEQTKALATDFGRPGGVGEKLQKLLEKRAEEKESWLIEWWNQVAYLGFRQPVVVHSSPGIGFPLMQAKGTHQLIGLAAKFILSILKWNLLIQHEAVPPDVYRKKPMCMSQYGMYSKCRIPSPGVDRVRHTPITESKHIIVIRNGHFFQLDVLYECPDGTLAVPPSSHIIEQLHNIMKMSSDPSECPVGILTSEHRDSWAKSRERLIVEPINSYSLGVIERAQFVVCLDQSHPGTAQLQSSDATAHDYHKTILANRVLHGNGSPQNSCNRWFDDAVQFFIGEDGLVGFLLEHSAADGPPAIMVAVFTLDLMKLGYDILGESSPVPSSVLRPAEKLQWKISEETTEDIQAAKKNLDELVEDVDLQLMTFDDFGKNIPKTFKLSPDGFIQMAIQLAYYKVYGHPTATYESGGTRWFLRGRTDTIRSCTNAAHTFVQTMVNPTATVEERAKTLASAVKSHSDYTNDAISGQAVDRHLLGLRLIAQEAGMEIHDFFKDEAYSKSLHFCLSTSQVPTAEHDIFLCFGAVVPDGYGVCYNPQEKRVTFAVSSFRSCPETDSLMFGDKLMESMREMQSVLVKANGLSAKL